MRFDISSPPDNDGEMKERLSDLISWLCCLTETLNVVLNSISEDNLSPGLREALEKLTERNESNDI